MSNFFLFAQIYKKIPKFFPAHLHLLPPSPHQNPQTSSTYFPSSHRPFPPSPPFSNVPSPHEHSSHKYPYPEPNPPPPLFPKTCCCSDAHEPFQRLLFWETVRKMIKMIREFLKKINKSVYLEKKSFLIIFKFLRFFQKFWQNWKQIFF